MLPATCKFKGDQVDTILQASSPTPNVLVASMPQGLLRRAWLHFYFAAINAGGGSAVVGGDYVLIRALTVRDNLHGLLMPNIDGLGLARCQSIIKSMTIPRTTLTTTAMDVYLPVDFGHWGWLRRPSQRINDSSLWEFADKVRFEFTLGAITDIISGGTSPTCTVRARVLWEFDPHPNPNPEVKGAATGTLADAVARGSKSGDRPNWQREVVMFDPIGIQTGTYEVPLQIGLGRVPLFLIFSERDLNNVEQSDIFTQYTTEITLWHGQDIVWKDIPLTDLDQFEATEQDFALPTGWHILKIIPDAKVLDSIKLDSVTEFKLRFINVANATSRKLRFYQWNMVPVNPAAAPEAQQVAQS